LIEAAMIRMMKSAFGWKRIIAIAVALSDTTVLTMNKNFSLLVDDDGACRSFGLGLSIVLGRIALVSFTANCPPVFTGYDVLVFAHFCNDLSTFKLRSKAIYLSVAQ